MEKVINITGRYVHMDSLKKYIDILLWIEEKFYKNLILMQCGKAQKYAELRFFDAEKFNKWQ